MSKTTRPNEIHNSTTSEQVPLDQLSLAGKPLRICTKSLVRLAARIIEQFGFLGVLLVDENNRVIGGVLYFLAAQLLELPHVPVVRVTHLSDEQIRTYRIRGQRRPDDGTVLTRKGRLAPLFRRPSLALVTRRSAMPWCERGRAGRRSPKRGKAESLRGCSPFIGRCTATTGQSQRPHLSPKRSNGGKS